MPLRRALAVVIVLGLTACAKEAGRVRLPGEGSGAVELPLSEGEVSFWTDLDIAYEGDATLTYKVELYQNGTKEGSAECSPLGHLDVRANWVETNVGASHSKRGNGKMDCSAKLAKGGTTMVKTSLTFGKRPATVTLKKADLVVKQ